MVDQLKKEIAQGNIQEVIQQLLLVKDEKFHTEVVQLSAQYESYKEKERLGLSTQEELNISLNRITNSLLQVLTELPKGSAIQGIKTVENKSTPWKIFGVGALLIISAIGAFFFMSRDDSFSINVLVKENGQSIQVSSLGQIQLDHSDIHKKEDITDKGKAVFRNLPADHIGEDFHLHYVPSDSSPYRRTELITQFEENKFYIIELKRKRKYATVEDSIAAERTQNFINNLRTSEPGKCYFIKGKISILDTIIDEQVLYVEKLIIKPAHREGAEFKSEPIYTKTSEVGLRWTYTNKENCLNKKGEIICINEIPSNYKQFTKYELIKDGDGNQVKEVVEYVDRYSQNQSFEFSDSSIIESMIEVVCPGEVPSGLYIKIQNALKDLGYSIELSGKFDAKTKKALLSFQKDNEIPVGNLDEETLKALGL